MAVQGALWLAKRLSLKLNFSFLNRTSLLLIQVATQLSSRGWVHPVPDPVLPEKFLGYSRDSYPGPLGLQSDVLTTIPNRWSRRVLYFKLYRLNQNYRQTFTDCGGLLAKCFDKEPKSDISCVSSNVSVMPCSVSAELPNKVET